MKGLQSKTEEEIRVISRSIITFKETEDDEKINTTIENQGTDEKQKESDEKNEDTIQLETKRKSKTSPKNRLASSKEGVY